MEIKSLRHHSNNKTYSLYNKNSEYEKLGSCVFNKTFVIKYY
jgi:hypothetical protein